MWSIHPAASPAPRRPLKILGKVAGEAVGELPFFALEQLFDQPDLLGRHLLPRLRDYERDGLQGL